MNTVTQSAKTQACISPEVAVKILKEGNERFISNKRVNREFLKQVEETAGGQYPFAAVVSCIDSRVPTEVVFDLGIGDIFNVRVAGNIVNDDILGSLEFACKIAGAKAIVVMGHTSCGAIMGACDGAQLGNLTQMLNKIKPAVELTPTINGELRTSKNTDFVNKVATKNVELTIQTIKKNSDILNEMHQCGSIAIVGAMYDVKTGKITFS
ncbi:carbonic anhydrase family protein [Carboxylicivirga taeanensis]|uniref:carbonic anhydrase family protein n=1 Tax=Carboxylicivirga taeanensis TaxID=1416875 RepID=UPI003F6DC1AA